MMNWPRGRYNGRRIVGVEFTFIFDVTEWRWLPTIGHGCGMFHWLCFRSWTNAAYEMEWKRKKLVALGVITDNELRKVIKDHVDVSHENT